MITIVLVGGILSGVPALAATEINYWLWDNNQLPSYQACAEAFEKQNPDIKIKITQTGWLDYWAEQRSEFVVRVIPGNRGASRRAPDPNRFKRIPEG